MAIRLIFVVTWRYVDGSASGIVSAHPTEVAAKHMLSLLATHGDGMKSFGIVETPFED